MNPPAVIDRLEALLEAGERDGVVVTMMRELVGATPEVVRYMRSLPAWQARVSAAHTIPRELRAEDAYRFNPGRFRFKDLRVPTLLLSGEDSPEFMAAINKAVDEVLPDSRIVVMPGQGHVAMDTSTELFTTEALRFLTAR
jgi:pimeloyl-ACP methyl ester carboxylesterase